MWSYSANPSVVAVDAIRLLTDDTVETDTNTLQDEELQFFIDEEENTYRAAAAALRARAVKFARLAQSQTISRLSLTYGSRATDLRERADELDARGSGHQTPMFEAQSVTQKETFERDTDRVQPAFKRGMHDNEEAGSQVDESDYDPVFP